MEAVVVPSKEIGLEVNADNTQNLVISRDQKAGRSHNIKINNGSFESLEEFTYLEITVKKQSSLHEEIKSRLKSGNACNHSVKNTLSSSLLSKNIIIEVSSSSSFGTKTLCGFSPSQPSLSKLFSP